VFALLFARGRGVGQYVSVITILFVAYTLVFACYLLVSQSEFSCEITRNELFVLISDYLVLLVITRTIIPEKCLGRFWSLELLVQENCISLFLGTNIYTHERSCLEIMTIKI
jgi:hypothetical protein